MPRKSIPVITALCLTTPALADDDGRPAYMPNRADEDWSDLSTATTDDLFDPIKRVDLNDDGSIWASFGGSARIRAEAWSGFDFGNSSPDSDEFSLLRLRLHGDFHITEYFRGFLETKSAWITDRDLLGGERPSDEDKLDLHQAFVEVSYVSDDWGITLRPGRQELSFGAERLVSPARWSNAMRSFDGISAEAQLGDWDITGFWTRAVEMDSGRFNTTDSATDFWGFYAEGRLAGSLHADAYFLGLERRDPVTFNGTTGTERRYTIGGRVHDQFGLFGYDIETAYQFGDVGPGDVSAYFGAGEIWFGTREVDDVQIFVGAGYATGDESPGGDVETFNKLFASPHRHLGAMDLIGRQNITDISAGFRLSPFEGSTLQVAGHGFWVSETSDALYDPAGNVSRAGGLATSESVGAEFDVTFQYRFDRHLTGLVGYSHFIAGDFIDETGTSDAVDFLYLQFEYTF